MVRVAILVTALACGACEKADHAPIDRSPAGLITLELYGVDQLPRVEITVPRFAAGWSQLPPTAYMLMGGSVRDLLTSIFVGARSGCREVKCPNEQLVETAEHRMQTCRSDDGATVVVEHHRLSGPICCTAHWKIYGELTDEKRRIARGVEAACMTIR